MVQIILISAIPKNLGGEDLAISSIECREFYSTAVGTQVVEICETHNVNSKENIPTITDHTAKELQSLKYAYKDLEIKYCAQQKLISDLNEANKHLKESLNQKELYCSTLEKLKLKKNFKYFKSFILSTGKKVHKNILEDLISRTADTEVSSIFKLSEKHLRVEGTEKQNVTLASQLLSHSTATAIKRYYNTEESNNLEYFIQLVNDWFDIMNLRNLKESQVFKKPYQANKEQVDRLEEMYQVFKNMLCGGKKVYKFFRKPYYYINNVSERAI
ncbi:hypothetical protein JTB14_036063 [Gonioctena quinquepunctata]|nr:hypothetical protein JTB14_036063 [Gonioctena quinquepunctata]